MRSETERFAGCLLGVMVGDSLGFRVQGLERRLVAQRYPDACAFAELTPGPYGAPTLMTRALAESMIGGPDVHREDLCARLVEVYDPARGFGRGTARAIARLGESGPAAMPGPGGRASYGNGAATRSAPIGLVFAEDVERLRWNAERAAELTHAHTLGIDGAVLQALAVATALRTGGRRIDPEGYLRTLGEQARTREFAARLRTAAELVSRDKLSGRTVVDRLGNARGALGSVATAAFCFARHADSFEGAVVEALGLGGAACSIASMTGALAGAHLGVGAIPERWLARCGDERLGRADLLALAEDLRAAGESARD